MMADGVRAVLLCWAATAVSGTAPPSQPLPPMHAWPHAARRTHGEGPPPTREGIPLNCLAHTHGGARGSAICPLCGVDGLPLYGTTTTTATHLQRRARHLNHGANPVRHRHACLRHDLRERGGRLRRRGGSGSRGKQQGSASTAAGQPLQGRRRPGTGCVCVVVEQGCMRAS